MRHTSMFIIVSFISVAAVLLFFSSVYAQQLPGSSASRASSTAALTDTVVNPHGSAIEAPVTNVHWRGWRGGRFYGARFHRGFYSRPYLYKSYPYSYRYYSSYPYSRCWWNGYRWVCPKKVIVY